MCGKMKMMVATDKWIGGELVRSCRLDMKYVSWFVCLVDW